MLFGIDVTIQMLVPGGLALAALLVFQLLTGLRVIKFKGRKHGKVHRWAAYLMVLFAITHGALGLALALSP